MDFETTVLSNKKYNENNFILTLKKPDGFIFKAGQFIMAKVGGVDKPFSVGTPPSRKNIELLIKMHDDGKVSPTLYRLKKGDKMQFSGPYGTLIVKDTSSKELIFIGAGTGISPIRSMVCDAFQRFPDKKITLIFGFRYDYFFEKEFKELEIRHPNFSLKVCCSKPDSRWKGLAGRVTKHLKMILTSPKDKEVYLCGSPNMVKDTKKQLLQDLKFKKEKVHTEQW